MPSIVAAGRPPRNRGAAFDDRPATSGPASRWRPVQWPDPALGESNQREPIPMSVATDLDRLAIDTIRTLSIDAVQQANSGHPGAPMGAAPMAYVVWTRFLRHAPTRPDWVDRDRFVLSAGHASMLLYSLLHLTGYGVSLDDLRSFRQWGSITPGHPEHGLTPGVEATTGPLGQGFANAVGMAVAERRLASEFNRPGHDIVDHRTFVIASDGDLQEGIASEAASLAGHLQLGKLIVLYDDNHIQLDGPTAMAFSEDVPGRFDAYGWHTQRIGDGNDLPAIEAAVAAAVADRRPSLIAVRTHIGFGSPNKQDSQKAHGAPLGPDEVRLTKEAYGWDPDRTFYVPPEAAERFREAIPKGEALVADWEAAWDRYRDAYPDAAAEHRRRQTGGDLPGGWDADLPTYETGSQVATRNASQESIAALAPRLPELFGGAADLSESNLTDVKGAPDFSAGEAGRNLRFGVREHAMGGIANGIALHGGFIPYVGTFLTFSDYMRGSVRLAALTGLHVAYVWTHDSVGLGEDGPTHQPVEHYAALRAIPNLWFVRPGDANEAAAAWALAVERRDGPVALALTRQKLPTLPGTDGAARDGVARGGYIVREASNGSPELILIGTGSELQLAFTAADVLERDGIPTRVVSLPCWERFDEQDQAYRDGVLPPTVRNRVSVEAGASLGWERWVGDEGAIVGLDHFGASAPAGTIFEHFGFTTERVADVARRVVRDGLRGRIPTLDGGHFGGHPSLAAGDPGVPRDGGTDPGHS
jgi:transketolase